MQWKHALTNDVGQFISIVIGQFTLIVGTTTLLNDSKLDSDVFFLAATTPHSQPIGPDRVNTMVTQLPVA